MCRTFEKEDYVLRHKTFKTIEELHNFIKGLTTEDFNKYGDESPVMEILTVSNKEDFEEDQYIVSFEIILSPKPTYEISIYFVDVMGLVLYDYYPDDIERYDTMEQIEESCVNALKNFTKFMESLNKKEEEIDV